MKIFIKKKVVNIPKHEGFFYEIDKVEYCCNEIEDAFNKGILDIVNATWEDVLNYIMTDDSDKDFLVGIVNRYIEDVGDYDYDDNWIENYQESENYLKILKCPFCGEDIEIEVFEVDISKEYQEILDRFPVHKKTKAEKELIKKLNKEMECLTRSFYEY